MRHNGKRLIHQKKKNQPTIVPASGGRRTEGQASDVLASGDGVCSPFLWCTHTREATDGHRLYSQRRRAMTDPLRSPRLHTLPDEPAPLKDNFLSAAAGAAVNGYVHSAIIRLWWPFWALCMMGVSRGGAERTSPRLQRKGAVSHDFCFLFF